MNQKKVIALTVLGLGLAAGLLIAANEPAAAPTPAPAPAPAMDPVRDAIRDRVVEKLGLDAEQQKKIDALRAERDAAIAALKADTSLAPDAKREKGRALFMDYRAKMLAVLTPEQQKKAAEWRAFTPKAGPGPQAWAKAPQPQRRPEMGQMGPARQGPRHPLAIVAVSERIKDRIAEKLGLTDEQRDKLEHLGRAFRAQQREAMKKHLEEMRAVLTPEQQQKVDAWKQHRRPAGRGPGPGPRVGFEDEDAPEGMMVAANGDDDAGTEPEEL